MVGSGHIQLHNLTLEELTGVVNLYPWFGAAHVELCRRTSGEYSEGALYVADRSILARIARGTSSASFTDKDLGAILASYLEPSAETTETEHQVRVVGGDYFSQAQYDNVKADGDNVFSRFAVKSPSSAEAPEDLSEMADRFATETLARIFAEQGRMEEAKRIYSRLILEFPEKSAYFAALIDQLT